MSLSTLTEKYVAFGLCHSFVDGLSVNEDGCLSTNLDNLGIPSEGSHYRALVGGREGWDDPTTD